MTTRSEDEVADEHKDKEEERGIDEDALAALVRPSLPPVENEEAEARGPEEDSVLDLRALAASAPPPPMDLPAAAAPARGSDAPERPAASARAEGEPVAARPVVPERRGSSGLITGLLIGAAAVGGVVWYMSGDRGAVEPPAIASTGPSAVQAVEAVRADESRRADEAAAAEGAEGPAGVQAVEGTESESTTSQPAEAPAAAAGAGAHQPGTRPQAAAPRGQAGTPMAATPSSADTTAPTTMAQASTTTMSAASSEGGLDSMLDRALGGRPAEGGTRTERVDAVQPAAQQPAGQDLPATPSRADVARSLGRLVSAIRQCAGDQVGMANATIIVRNDGTVASVSIGGSPFGGTPQGACMEGVIRRATFPRFSQSTFRISYPFAIRPST